MSLNILEQSTEPAAKKTYALPKGYETRSIYRGAKEMFNADTPLNDSKVEEQLRNQSECLVSAKKRISIFGRDFVPL